jgi:predicted lipoprotein with Yx(FWY)xxD motif
MTHTRHLGRFVAVGVGALVLSGAGIASATTPPTEPPGDTAMAATSEPMAAAGATSEPMAGAGPSNCPAITEEAEATATSEAAAMATAPAGTAVEPTEAPAGTEAMATEAPAGSEPTASVAAVSGPFVQIVETDEYGPILADHECRTLYTFANDVDGQPTCVDDCATNWPPLLTTDGTVPALADELDPSLFSVVDHPDGSQLKVGDWPLYYFAGDSGPSQTNGQGVGGVWWLVSPDGTQLVEAEETAGTAAAEGSAPAESMPAATTGG